MLFQLPSIIWKFPCYRFQHNEVGSFVQEFGKWDLGADLVASGREGSSLIVFWLFRSLPHRRLQCISMLCCLWQSQECLLPSKWVIPLTYHLPSIILLSSTILASLVFGMVYFDCHVNRWQMDNHPDMSPLDLWWLWLQRRQILVQIHGIFGGIEMKIWFI